MNWLEEKRRKYAKQSPPPKQPDSLIDKILWVLVLPLLWLDALARRIMKRR